MIKLVSVDKISNHPENPRKDLGDLTELAQSIKQNGILQNLTIVPWYSTITGVGADDPKQQEEMGYYALIGNRRLAAAKLAGLKEVPCAIADMDHKTQIATMLTENMQRSDLTVYEQAQGFQMMMDLGDTVSNISEKTGFSETTVRRRTKLLELNQEKLKETMVRGATLADYAKLEQIENIELRNEVLEKIGTSDFDWTLRRAIEDEKRKKKFNEILSEVQKFATEVEDTSELEYETAYWGNPSEKFTMPENADEVEYFYCIKYDYIYLYYKSLESEEPNKAEEEKERHRERLREERRLKLENITRIAYELRQDFVKSYSNAKAKKNIGTIIENIIFATAETYYSPDYGEIADILNIDIDEKEDVEWEDLTDEIRKQPELSLLAMTYNMLLDKGYHQYYNWNCEYGPNESLDNIYNFLKKLGYEMSEEEIELQNGTHKLFEKREV